MENNNNNKKPYGALWLMLRKLSLVDPKFGRELATIENSIGYSQIRSYHIDESDIALSL